MDSAKCMGGQLTAEERQKLATGCYQWAQNISRKYAQQHNVPESIRDDLISHALLGLCEAAAHYDPMKGAAFKSFAYRRIVGAIIDCLRMEYPSGYRRNNKQRYESCDVPVVWNMSHGRVLSSHGQSDGDGQAFMEGDGLDASNHMADDSEPVGWEIEYHDEVEYLASTMTEAGGPAASAWQAMFTQANRKTMKAAGLAVGVTEGRVSQFCRFAREALRDRARTIAATQKGNQ